MNEERPNILVVDDKPNMLKLMVKVLRGVADVSTADSGGAALSVLAAGPVDVVLCDLRMPDMSGLEVLHACTRLQPRAKFILMTAYATVDTAVTALKDGAYDYLTKPFEPEEARASVVRALHSSKPRRQVAADEVMPGVHAQSAVMRELSEFARRVATTDANVLIGGEAGSGKKRIARAIHALSSRSAAPFEVLDVAAASNPEATFTRLLELPRQTDRDSAEHSPPGTVFIDAVADLSADAQAQLNHALEQRVQRSSPTTDEPRLIAATSENLQARIAAGSFRQDLYLQLAIAQLHVPPLRSRREDIPVLAAQLLADAARDPSVPDDIAYSASAMERLVSGSWPGNVRELRSAVFGAVALADGGVIEVDVLPDSLHTAPDSAVQWDTLSWADALSRGRADVGRRYLVALLRRFGGDIVPAAKQADIERESFYRLLRKHGIHAEGFRRGDGE